MIPINESAAYFSNRNVLNHVATNPIWHLVNNLSSSALNEHNPFEKMKDEEAMVIQHALFNSSKGTITQVIN